MIICTFVPIRVTIKLFADDAKLYTVFRDSISATCLQSCLAAISEWCDHWQLILLYPSKCSVIHMVSARQRSTTKNFDYHIGQTKLPVVDYITDLGITYNNRLRFSPHVDKIVVKASLRAKLILSCFQSRNPNLLSKAFCVFVRPLLEFSSLVWNPMFKQDINKLESVERKFTKRLKGLRNFSHGARLTHLGLDSLHVVILKPIYLQNYQ